MRSGRASQPRTATPWGLSVEVTDATGSWAIAATGQRAVHLFNHGPSAIYVSLLELDDSAPLLLPGMLHVVGPASDLLSARTADPGGSADLGAVVLGADGAAATPLPAAKA
jgi:hypothetical protein